MKIAKKLCFELIAAVLKLQTWRLLRRNPDVKIVGVTGSVGKTVTKLAVAAVLAKKYKVLVHPGNYNSETGVPLSVFEMESPGSVLRLGAWIKIFWRMEQRLRRPLDYEFLVLELGASHGGDITAFKYLQPDLGIVTAAKPAHLEGFKNMETITNEKFRLAEFSKHALVNAEDNRLSAKLDSLPKYRLETFGITRGDYRYEILSFKDLDGFEGRLHLKHKQIDVKLALIARHNAYSAVAAAAAGDYFGVDLADIKAGVESLRPVSGRMNPLQGVNGSLIIDDTYNGNPEAMTAALDTLYSLGGRKIAILGGMNEMGGFEADYHDMVGSYCRRLDLLVTVADKAKLYIKPAIEAGLSPRQVVSFDTPYQAGEYVAKMLRPGDKVLVKGSQGGIFCEEATAKLLAHESDKRHLVRQSDFWQGVKSRAFGGDFGN
jgi:UDP-N-acetylmuramoyl-tripeptide--D-alanyl-D-alanine ligase